MELSTIYFDDNILFHIFKQLSLLEMIIFSHINKTTYSKFYNVIKNSIFDYINNDYYKFYKLLNIYKYTEQEINKLGILSINNIGTITTYTGQEYYDLRYLFELVNNGFNYNDNEYKKSTSNIILLMIKAMKRCISFTRFETIMKVYNEPILYSLRRNIQIKQPKNFLLLKV